MTDPEAAPLRPNDWVRGFALLVLCQLAGEATVSLLRLAVPAFAFPGPVAGMLYLLAFLAWRRSGIRAVTAVATGLLGALSLLFVPSAVGIMQHGAAIRGWGLPLILAILGSTFLTLLVTVAAFLATERWLARRIP